MYFQKVVFFITISSVFSCSDQFSSHGTDNPHAALTDYSSGVINGELISTNDPVAKSVVGIAAINAESAQEDSNCTGVLIGPNTVLTAAHCFGQSESLPAQNYKIVFEKTLQKNYSQKYRPITSYLKHPNFNSETKKWVYRNNKYINPSDDPQFYPQSNDKFFLIPQLDHDIAVVHFSGSIPAGYQVAALDKTFQPNYSNKQVLFYGFGYGADHGESAIQIAKKRPGVLRKGLAIIDTDYHNLKDRYHTKKTSANFVCQGDSGGPQFLLVGKSYKVIGINSAIIAEDVNQKSSASSVQSCRNRAQITKVSEVAGWIEQAQLELLNTGDHK